MPETSLAPPSPSTPQVVLSLQEWDEIQDSVIALHASISAGVHDEGEELLKAVYLRQEAALKPIRKRMGN